MPVTGLLKSEAIDMPDNWPEYVQYVAGILMTLAGILTLAVLIRLVFGKQRPRRYCPGVRKGFLARLSPLWWLIDSRCGYDLTGHLDRFRSSAHPVDASLVCPECGACHESPHRLLARPRQYLNIRQAIFLAGLSCLVALSHPVIQIRIMRKLPTDVLILTERVLKGYTPDAVRRPLRWRFDGERLSDRQRMAMIPLLIRDLRSDKRYYNADIAMRRLSRLGKDAMPPLQLALNSKDLQQRQFASAILRWLDSDTPPGDLMVQVVIEGLRDDRLPYDSVSGTRNGIYNAQSGVRYMAKHAAIAETHLRHGLDSGDWQQRLLCAVALGCGGCMDSIELAMPILIEHLLDNNIKYDATYAENAIKGFGSAAKPYLESHINAEDYQMRGIVLWLIEKLDDRQGEDENSRLVSALP